MSAARRLLNVAVLALFAGWGITLLLQSKGRDDYVVDRALQLRPQSATCQWLPIDTEHTANLGFSIEPEHAWSDRRSAYLALRVPDGTGAAWLDLDLRGVAAGEVTLSIDNSEQRFLVSRPRTVRVPVPEATTSDGIILLRFDSRRMQPPVGEDRRWLGIAIGGIRLCPKSGPDAD